MCKHYLRLQAIIIKLLKETTLDFYSNVLMLWNYYIRKKNYDTQQLVNPTSFWIIMIKVVDLNYINFVKVVN